MSNPSKSFFKRLSSNHLTGETSRMETNNDKKENEDIWMNKIENDDRNYISSEDSAESVTCHIQSAPMTQEQPWSKKEIVIALSNLPGGEVALSLIPGLHDEALQRVLEEFRSLTLNENADCKHRNFSVSTFADEYVE